uniref:GIY-YIG endonuclease n=1 Tax=Dioszegia changbaiensis TaxID=234950 RepID=A0A7G7XQD9_9TREE|nr:GIY-YIG endonuclease [Dioszegia changbaiensis]
MTLFLNQRITMSFVYNILLRLQWFDWFMLVNSHTFITLTLFVNAIYFDLGTILSTIVSNSWDIAFSGMSTCIHTLNQPMVITTLCIAVIVLATLDSVTYSHKHMLRLVVYLMLLVIPILSMLSPDVVQLVISVLSFYVEQCTNLITVVSPVLVYLFDLLVWIITLHCSAILLSIVVHVLWGTDSKLSLYLVILSCLRIMAVLRLALIASLIFSALSMPEVFLEHYSDCLNPSDMVNASVMPMLRSLFSLVIPVTYCEEEFIPYVHTYLLQSGVETLVRMYDAQPEGKFKQYLTDNCAHLLEPLQGSTGIPISKANVDNLSGHIDTIQLEHQYRGSLFSHLKGKAGLYVFFDAEDVYQCGSNVEFRTRLYSHYRTNGAVIPFYKVVNEKGGFGNFKYHPLLITTNYHLDYSHNYGSLTKEQLYILQSFTQQEVRSLEQAYSTYANPFCYKGTPISIAHLSWHPGFFQQHGGHKVTWVDKDGVEGFAPSINKASAILDVASSTIKKYANCLIETYMASSTQGDIKVHIDGFKYVNKPSDRVVEYNDLHVDTTGLPANKVFVYDGNVNKLEHLGPYDTVKQAAESLNLNWTKKYYTMLNKDMLIYVHSLATSVYLVSNRVSTKKAGLVTNMSSGNTVEFDSINSAVSSVMPDMSTAQFVRQYVLKRENFLSADGNTYLVEFKLDNDHTATAERVTKEQRDNSRKGKLIRSARRLEAKNNKQTFIHIIFLKSPLKSATPCAERENMHIKLLERVIFIDYFWITLYKYRGAGKK